MSSRAWGRRYSCGSADGDDLLVLSGPSMDLDGQVRIYRWHGAASSVTSRVVRGDDISRPVDLRYGERGDDHPEGPCRLDVDGRTRLLVVYDGPAAYRIDGKGILADVVSLG